MTLNIFLVISLICLSLYLFGLKNFLLSHEENACKMTYMYEFPQFIKINVSNAQKYEKYNLYAYSEGRLTGKARNMHFDGIPVLFIPGNAGSYKQVRSLASVSLRKYLNSKSRFHFDYFCVDLNEEYSGLFGGVLEAQSLFVNHSIHTILNLYDKNTAHPKSIVLIGHSIGGLIAQHVVTIDENSQRVNTIITLATPNKKPVAALDQLIPTFYTETFKYWTENFQIMNMTNKSNKAGFKDINKENSKFSDILFISIGGGSRDILVPSGLTSSKFGHINTLTTAIPMVWASTDHQCIVWCLQLVLVLNRVLFQSVDSKSKQISTNLEERYNTALRLLTINTALPHSKIVHFRKNSEWYEDNRRLFSVRFLNGLNRTRYQMIRLTDDQLHEMIAVESINLDDEDWIFGCAADQIDIKLQSRICDHGLSLSNYTRPHPSINKERRIAYLDLHKIKRQNPHWTHVLFQISPTRESVQLHFDIYNRNQRIMKTNAPKIYSFSKVEVVKETLLNAIHYDLIIQGFDSLYQALHLSIDPKQCSEKSYHTVATSYVPWASGHSNVHYFTEAQRLPMSLKLHQSQQDGKSSKNVRVRFVLDPNCKYFISLESSFVDTLGQISRHYSLGLLPYCASVLILALRQQILQIQDEGKCSNLLSAMTSGAKPYYVVTLARLAQKLLSFESSTPMLLPLLSFAVAWGIICIIGLIVYAGIAVAGKLAHTVMLRIISFGASGFAAKAFERLPLAVGVLAVAMGSATCGCVSLMIAVVFYSILLSKMYEDYVDTIVFKTIRKVARKLIGGSHNKTTDDIKKNTQNVSDHEMTTNDNVHDKPLNDKNEKRDSEKRVLQTENKGIDITEGQTKDTLDTSFDKGTSSKDVHCFDDSNSNEKTGSHEKAQNSVLESHNEASDSKNKPQTVDVILPESDITLSEIHFHLTIFLILSFVTLLNFPTLLTWLHNFKYNPYLEIDPAFWISISLTICISIIWQINAPKTDLLFSREIGYLLYAFSVACLIFSNTALYTLNYLLISALILVTMHQCMPYFGFKKNQSPTLDNSATSQANNDKLSEDVEDKILINKVKVIKTKLQED
ncbi:GPI inositol-deacylase-like [Ctenocephalides felis]|uniref:GPI inositol-deacylase-like n=1 Tax=Ctenocephalides felis TaxID=7515 RepID=UPI000E6E1FA2|nr:GPI inositol-deacylase-like [Ctenocephalides felis]